MRSAAEREQAVRRRLEAANRGDFPGALAPYAPDAVWDLTSVGLGRLQGRAAIRGFFEDWQGSYEEFEMRLEDFRALQNGITLVLFLLRGRPRGSSSFVELRYAGVEAWKGGLIERATLYVDLDEAAGAAERLARERR